ncbi:hypothetical protein SAMN05421721_1302 [Ectothiorhodospira mobilis]|uniref:Uncharacterized protein n=1 Tax=Ectothiorhodospira mobilis TaxID=195064 RepID=A0A1I4T1J3_ECTMO|nr:hypothetical protein SAMN05421721_1302 [Ectothiorhodospira mobilis]
MTDPERVGHPITSQRLQASERMAETGTGLSET